MSCIADLLAAAAQDIEGQVRRQLDGPFGGVIRAYLPQTWVFRTEDGAASLTVDAHGMAQVAAGAAPSPDVTIETSHARLEAALRTRRRESVPDGPLKVTPHTEKGRTVFSFLRSRLGM